MNKQNVEAILPLTPTQEALLLHSLAQPLDQGFIQVQAEIAGELDAERLRLAWESVVRRHLALRTSLHAPTELKPRLIAWRSVETAWVVDDWTSSSEAEQEVQLQQFCADDRARGLSLSQVPVWRVHLIRLSAERHHLVWSCHHLLLDGWSTGIALRDLARAYQSLSFGEAPPGPAAASPRNYLAWRKAQPPGEALDYWRRRLEGAGPPTPLPFDAQPERRRRASGSRGEGSVRLSAAVQTRLEGALSQSGLTASSLVAGAWALLLGQHAGSSEVIFGSTVSGRPADLSGVGELVGMFSHVNPTRIAIPTAGPTDAWLRSIRDRHFESQAFEHVSVAELVASGGATSESCAFESLVILENFPAQDTALDPTRGVTLEHRGSGLTTTYPLTLVVIPGSPWTLRCLHAEERIAPSHARLLMEQLRALLERIVESPERDLASLHEWLAAHCATYPPRSEAGAEPRRDEGARTPRGGAEALVQAPRSAIERRLAELWCTILRIDAVGIHENFFELGGDSLQSMRLVAEIEKHWGNEVALTTFFANPTIAEFARILEGDTPAKPSPAEPLDTRADLSPEQRDTVRELHDTIASPVIPSDSRFGFWPGWGLRRRAASLALGALAYARAHALLKALTGARAPQQLLWRHRTELTRRFLAAIDSHHPSETVIARSLLCSSLLHYRVGPWGVHAPTPTRHPPQLHLEGFEEIERLRAAGTGVVLVSCHDNALFWLSLLEAVDAGIGGVHLVLEQRGIDSEAVRNALLSHQLDGARRTLRAGGVVSIAGDGAHGASAGSDHRFHGRVRRFRSGFAELALAGDASVFVVRSDIGDDGRVALRLLGPLDAGDAAQPREERIRRLVDQFVALYAEAWSEAPWMIPWNQMTKHLALPPCDDCEDDRDDTVREQ